MAFLRILIFIGILIGAVLGCVWVLGLAPDEEIRQTIGKVAGVMAVLVIAGLGIYLVGGKPTTSGSSK